MSLLTAHKITENRGNAETPILERLLAPSAFAFLDVKGLVNRLARCLGCLGGMQLNATGLMVGVQNLSWCRVAGFAFAEHDFLLPSFVVDRAPLF